MLLLCVSPSRPSFYWKKAFVYVNKARWWVRPAQVDFHALWVIMKKGLFQGWKLLNVPPPLSIVAIPTRAWLSIFSYQCAFPWCHSPSANPLLDLSLFILSTLMNLFMQCGVDLYLNTVDIPLLISCGTNVAWNLWIWRFGWSHNLVFGFKLFLLHRLNKRLYVFELNCHRPNAFYKNSWFKVSWLEHTELCSFLFTQHR